MDSLQAFQYGEMNRHKELMVFDWEKAVDIINEGGYKNCAAGLDGYYELTAGRILKDGRPYFDDYTYLASTWATPQLIVCDENDNYVDWYDCYIMQNQTTWGSDTKFPKEQAERLK